MIRYTAGDVNNEDLSPNEEIGPVRVMNKNDLFHLIMFERSGSGIWKKIVYMQAVVKSKMSDTLAIPFINKSTDAMKSAGSSFNLPSEAALMISSPVAYCHLI